MLASKFNDMRGCAILQYMTMKFLAIVVTLPLATYEELRFSNSHKVAIVHTHTHT